MRFNTMTTLQKRGQDYILAMFMDSLFNKRNPVTKIHLRKEPMGNKLHRTYRTTAKAEKKLCIDHKRLLDCEKGRMV